MRVGLVGCVKQKHSRPTRADQLYTSTMFQGRRRFVEQSCDSWFILSALHGLVEPDRLLEPYDVTLKGSGIATRRAWSADVLRDIGRRFAHVDRLTFEIHAGSNYRDAGLVEGIVRLGATVEIPASGLSQGEQLAFYKRGYPVPPSRRA